MYELNSAFSINRFSFLTYKQWINKAKDRPHFDRSGHNGEAAAKEETKKGMTFREEKLNGAKKKNRFLEVSNTCWVYKSRIFQTN